MIRFTVPGDAVPWQRPRFNNGRGFEDKRVTAYRKAVGLYAMAAMTSKKKARIDIKPIRLTVKVYRPIPKSFSKKNRALAMDGMIRPVTRPDLSNYIKCIEDALNGIAYRDDSQVVSYDGSGKWYAEEPCVVVAIDEID